MNDGPIPRDSPTSDVGSVTPGAHGSGSDASESSSGLSRKLKSLLSGESVRGALKLTGGSGLAQLIAFVVAPIVTRLYSPSDYGALAIYTSVSAILISVAAGRYELAIILPEDDEDATAVAGVALLLTTITSALTLIGTGLLYLLYPAVSESAVGGWVFIIPLTVLMGGWSATFVAFATRHGEFGTIAAMGVVRQAIGSAVSIGLGLLRFGAGGLILGGFLSVSAANARLGRPVLRDLRTHRPTRTKLLESARQYSRFPRHTLPASLLNTAGISGLPILIGSLFGAATLGVWALTQKILAMPSVLVGQAASETYYRRAVQLRDSPKQALRLFDKTVLLLATISIVPFVFVGVSGEWLFGFVFGPEWSEAGVYARIMLPWLWIRFISSPTMRTTLVYERNAVGLGIQSWLIVQLFLATVITVTFSLEFEAFLTILSGLNATAYAGFLVVCRRIVIRSRKPDSR